MGFKTTTLRFRVSTNLCGLRANGGKVSGYTEHEVFYLHKVVGANAGGLINQEHDICHDLALTAH